jgi:hypothetical protein
MLSEVFWSLLITTLVGFLLALARMCYKSKCKSIECCCLKIKRDVSIEEEEHKFDIERGIEKKESIEM